MNNTAVYARLNGVFRPISTYDILYIAASRNYSEITTIDKGKLIICVPIGEVEKQLVQNLFCRIHKSYIVSLHQISGYTYHKVFIGDKELPLGKTYFGNFMARTVRIQCSRDRQMEEEIKNMSAEEYLKKYRKEAGDDESHPHH